MVRKMGWRGGRWQESVAGRACSSLRVREDAAGTGSFGVVFEAD